MGVGFWIFTHLPSSLHPRLAHTPYYLIGYSLLGRLHAVGFMLGVMTAIERSQHA